MRARTTPTLAVSDLSFQSHLLGITASASAALSAHIVKACTQHFRAKRFAPSKYFLLCFLPKRVPYVQYLHESRHMHALNRVRGPKGRFVNFTGDQASAERQPQKIKTKRVHAKESDLVEGRTPMEARILTTPMSSTTADGYGTHDLSAIVDASQPSVGSDVLNTMEVDLPMELFEDLFPSSGSSVSNAVWNST